MPEKTIIESMKFLSVTVFRAKGSYILTMQTFTDIEAAFTFVKSTPADQQWSLQFNLKFDHTYDSYYNKDGTTATYSTGQNSYRGAYYD